MVTRNDARKVALQMLFLIDQNPDADLNRIQKSMKAEIDSEPLMQFAWSLFSGVRQHRAELDELIRNTASNWRLERMAPTDRNVLRIGIYEMRYLKTPVAVALNEAIEIAREFGSANSAGFVNGILDKLAPRSESAATSVDEAADETEISSAAAADRTAAE